MKIIEAKYENKYAGKKVYKTMTNVGKVKYLVDYHDGIKTHPDGSTFFDIATFSAKDRMQKFIKDLEKDGYKEIQFY